MSQQESELTRLARDIFLSALKKVDAGQAINDAVRLRENILTVAGEQIDLSKFSGVYAVAIGKAAYPMAAALDRILHWHIRAGLVSGTRQPSDGHKLGNAWSQFEGGHPLPNEASISAARACLEMLEKADTEAALVIFLISGGGSAMMEAARDPDVTLSELRETNHVLVTSGASISEINSVRRAISAIKGGGLARKAPNCRQITLLISDTLADDITSIASGPTLKPAAGLPDADAVVKKYELESHLPVRIRELILNKQAEEGTFPSASTAHVLLDNSTATRAAAEAATSAGLLVEAGRNEYDASIDVGCKALLDKCIAKKKAASDEKTVCLISGGEFGCEVVGNGVGGRNSETVLRLALLAEEKEMEAEFAFLSAGTDGIDGNSPAAGGVADHCSLQKATKMGFDPRSFLADSDSFTFLDRIGASIMTGPTGTNVRDIRLLLMR